MATIEGSSSYLVSKFAIQTDQPTAYRWQAITDGPIMDASVQVGLNHSSVRRGGAKGRLKFALLTQDMISYLWTNIWGSTDHAAVTVQLAHQRRGKVTYNCIFVWPFTDPEAEFRWLDEEVCANVVIRFYDATDAAAS